MSTVKIQTRVLSGHRIEVNTPQFAEGQSVDVVVSPHEQPGIPDTSPQDALRLPIEQRRQILMQQADGLVDYYEATEAERMEWQGGDIIE